MSSIPVAPFAYEGVFFFHTQNRILSKQCIPGNSENSIQNLFWSELSRRHEKGKVSLSWSLSVSLCIFLSLISELHFEQHQHVTKKDRSTKKQKLQMKVGMACSFSSEDKCVGAYLVKLAA